MIRTLHNRIQQIAEKSNLKILCFKCQQFHQSENNDVSNTSKSVNVLLEQTVESTRKYQNQRLWNVFCNRIPRKQNSFIDRLVEDQETKINEWEKGLHAKAALRLEFGSWHLPVVHLYLCIVLTEMLLIGQNLLNAFIHVYIVNLHSTTTSEWLTSSVD